MAGILSICTINNFLSYHIYTPIELFIVLNYFFRAANIHNAPELGLVFGSIAILLSILDTLLFQKYNTINSYYLLFEGIVIISFCLFVFYRIFIREDIIPKRMAVFWITCCFLFYWCMSYINLGMWTAIDYSSSIARILGLSLFYANLLFYICITFIFVYYKKLVPSGE